MVNLNFSLMVTISLALFLQFIPRISPKRIATPLSNQSGKHPKDPISSMPCRSSDSTPREVSLLQVQHPLPGPLCRTDLPGLGCQQELHAHGRRVLLRLEEGKSSLSRIDLSLPLGVHKSIISPCKMDLFREERLPNPSSSHLSSPPISNRMLRCASFIVSSSPADPSRRDSE